MHMSSSVGLVKETCRPGCKPVCNLHHRICRLVASSLRGKLATMFICLNQAEGGQSWQGFHLVQVGSGTHGKLQ